MTRMTQAMLPLLRRASGGRLVVNIASARPVASPECMFPYASSPDAFEKLSDMFKEQLRGTAIDVVALAPRHWPATPSSHWSDRLARREQAEEKAIAERIVNLVASSRPCWKHRPREVPRRA
jgi:NAD(P)-dependent dehydrogenase (short-subunit alcohol dehydrogenase family)